MIARSTRQNLQSNKEKLKEVFESLKEGDRILFNNRKEPLTVTAGYLDHDYGGGSVMVEGPRGAKYRLVQNKHNPNAIYLINLGTLYADGGRIESLKRIPQ